MNPFPSILLYSQDPVFSQKVLGSLHSVAKVQHAQKIEEIDRLLHQFCSVVLLVDLQGEKAADWVNQVLKIRQQAPVVAFGVPRSDPVLELEGKGVFSLEDRLLPWRELREVVLKAMKHLELIHENQHLHEEIEKLKTSSCQPKQVVSRKEMLLKPFRHLHRAFRHFSNPSTLFENVAEGVASTTMTSRVGIVSWERNKENFRLRAGLRCLKETQNIEYTKDDPFVRWLESHGHLVSRETLDHVKTPAEKVLLKKTLDGLGAEVIIPLQSRATLLGWLFVGHHVTGAPFDEQDLEDLLIVAEYLSTNLENVFLYEEVAIQKSLMESLLHSLPTGIAAVGVDGQVQWFNRAAEKLLGVSVDEVIHRPFNGMGGHVADLLIKTLKGRKSPLFKEWLDPVTKRKLFAKSYCLTDKNVGMGAVVMIEDRIDEQILREKQDQLDRAVFWSELAAAMSHQIRNPLVTIKTFAELFPERYGDADFRNKFGKLVPKEVDRLDSMVELINRFANPSKLTFQQLDFRHSLQEAVNLTKPHPQFGRVRIETVVHNNLPVVNGDLNAIIQCLYHLLVNAFEATVQIENPHIKITVECSKEEPKGVAIHLKDNGKGIPTELREKVFSPFCTTKTTGMGLGLPIVRRTVLDHNGNVTIESNDQGTCVAILLPTSQLTIL